MAAVVAVVVIGHIVGAVGDPADVESDTIAAVRGSINFHVDTIAGNTGFIVADIPQSVAATLVPGPATLIISQGAGTVTQAVTA